MHIIPAIDLIEGKCVRLTQGDFNTKRTYHEEPLDIARRFEDVGIKRLHLVDLDGAKSGAIVNWKVLEKLASNTTLHIDFGGGVGSDKDIEIAFECGAAQVTGGSVAVKKKELFLGWLERYGKEKIILGADVKDEKISVSGWQEDSEVFLFDFLGEYEEKGIQYVITTDVAKDGLLQGPSLDLYRRMREEFPKLNIIASGGVSSLEDLEKLEEIEVFGAIVGKALYEGKIALKDLGLFLN